jgi:predicted transcriptional regulator
MTGNMNQITRRVNFGETPEGAEFIEALSGIKEILAKIRGALGYEE